MSIIKKSINNNEYEFVNSSRSNRSGFVHETKLYKNGNLIGEAKVQYYNRTWETYCYQTVMKRCVYILIDAEFTDFRESYKIKHNIKRMTGAKEAEMMQDFVEYKPTLYADMQELYETL